MTPEQILLVVFAFVIIILMLLVILMNVRMKQLVREIRQMEARLSLTDTELDALMRNVEEIKKLKI